MSIKDRIAFAFDTKYLSFFFRADGRLDEGLAITLVATLITAIYVFLTQAILIVLPTWFLLCIVAFRIHWKPVILKVISWLPDKKK